MQYIITQSYIRCKLKKKKRSVIYTYMGLPRMNTHELTHTRRAYLE